MIKTLKPIGQILAASGAIWLGFSKFFARLLNLSFEIKANISNVAIGLVVTGFILVLLYSIATKDSKNIKQSIIIGLILFLISIILYFL